MLLFSAGTALSRESAADTARAIPGRAMFARDNENRPRTGQSGRGRFGAVNYLAGVANSDEVSTDAIV